MKNKRHALKILIESCRNRHDDYVVEHWENMIRLIASKAKQNKVARNRAMQAFITAPSQFSSGGKVGVARRLVSP